MSYPSHPGPSYGQYSGGPAPQGHQPMPPTNPYGGPPPSGGKKTGLWVGLGIGVVAVVAFVVTAFVAPGFLVGDDTRDDRAVRTDTPAGMSQPSSPSTGLMTDLPEVDRTEAEELGSNMGEAMRAGQADALAALICADASETVKAFVSDLEEPQPGTYVHEVTEVDGVARGSFASNGPALGKPEIQAQVTVVATLVPQKGGWCWQELQDSLTYFDGIAAALNGGELQTLRDMKCQYDVVTVDDPLADAVADDSEYAMRSVTPGGPTPSAEFVGGDNALRLTLSVQKGQFCLLSALRG
jgi:hypothetical protein